MVWRKICKKKSIHQVGFSKTKETFVSLVHLPYDFYEGGREEFCFVQCYYICGTCIEPGTQHLISKLFMKKVALNLSSLILKLIEINIPDIEINVSIPSSFVYTALTTLDSNLFFQYLLFWLDYELNKARDCV